MDDASGPRPLPSLVAVVAGIVLLAALWLLPDLTPTDDVSMIGQESLHARIVEELPAGSTRLPRFAVEVLDGPSAGQQLEAVVQDGSTAISGATTREPYVVGDEVVVVRYSGPAGAAVVIAEPWRIGLLGLVAGVFAAVVLVIGGLRGARSLVALAITLAVVVKVVVPLLLGGVDPVLLAVAGGLLVTTLTLLLTEGPNRVTLAAVLGTFAALLLTAVLAAGFTALAEFTALQGNEAIAFLIPIVGDRIDLQGILLAATVFGALGVLDDVSVTQAATVEQLHRANPATDRPAVVGRAMRVGRSHIAATVNTLMLAYLGAGLPLLLLFAVGGQDPVSVLNGEVVAVEVIRALVGSIGIVTVVPLTTVVAAWLIVPGVRHSSDVAA